MDPFEVRIRFTSLIVNLNASVTSATKASQYALKYRDMDEDLHSCIIEQLELPRNSMNNRANIMYFIEHLCDMATRERHIDYVRMIQRDMVRIVDAVAPEDGSGAANVKVVRKVLQALGTKNHLETQTVNEIEDLLKERDTSSSALGLSSPLTADNALLLNNNDTTTTTTTTTNNNTTDTINPTPSRLLPQRIDKKVAEQRIEEDRERHKRLRENIWAIPAPRPGTSITEAELDQLWEETSDIGEDDFELYREEAEERARCARYYAEEWQLCH